MHQLNLFKIKWEYFCVEHTFRSKWCFEVVVFYTVRLIILFYSNIIHYLLETYRYIDCRLLHTKIAWNMKLKAPLAKQHKICLGSSVCTFSTWKSTTWQLNRVIRIQLDKDSNIAETEAFQISVYFSLLSTTWQIHILWFAFRFFICVSTTS